jgi:hypothetical protein
VHILTSSLAIPHPRTRRHLKQYEHHILVAGAADSPPPTATARDRAWATPNFPRHPFLVSHAVFSAPRTTTASSEIPPLLHDAASATCGGRSAKHAASIFGLIPPRFACRKQDQNLHQPP